MKNLWKGFVAAVAGFAAVWILDLIAMLLEDHGILPFDVPPLVNPYSQDFRGLGVAMGVAVVCFFIGASSSGKSSESET
jgi:hypothetical protein